jgi:hypothetical protein
MARPESRGIGAGAMTFGQATAEIENHQPLTKGNPMRQPIRYQSQLLFRKSTKPNRVIRVRPGQRLNLVFRPSRSGPYINQYEREKH